MINDISLQRSRNFGIGVLARIEFKLFSYAFYRTCKEMREFIIACFLKKNEVNRDLFT